MREERAERPCLPPSSSASPRLDSSAPSSLSGAPPPQAAAFGFGGPSSEQMEAPLPSREETEQTEAMAEEQTEVFQRCDTV